MCVGWRENLKTLSGTNNAKPSNLSGTCRLEGFALFVPSIGAGMPRVYSIGAGMPRVYSIGAGMPRV